MMDELPASQVSEPGIKPLVWQLVFHPMNGVDGWEKIGTFKSITAACLHIRDLEGNWQQGDRDPALVRVAMTLGVYPEEGEPDNLEHQGKHGLYNLYQTPE